MDLRRALWTFVLVAIFMEIADRLLFVLFPNYLLETGFSAMQIGAIFSAAALVLALSRFFIGRISDIHGRKRIVSAGLLLQAVAAALFPFLARIYEFAIVKSIKELGDTLRGSVEDAIIADTFPKSVRGRILSRLGTAFPIGRALGALIGVGVTAWLTVSQGFWIASCFIFLAFLAFSIGYKGTERTHYRALRYSLGQCSKRFKAVAIVGLLTSIGFGAAYYPGFFVLANNLGVSEPMLFAMLLIGYISSSSLAWWSGRWIDTVGRGRVLALFTFLIALFTAGYALASSIAQFAIVLFGITASFYIWRIAFKTVLMDATSSSTRGEQIGFAKMMQGIGDIIGPAAGGAVIEFASLPAAFLFSAATALLAVVIAAVAR